MSQLRQRKHNANNDDIENPPDLISTSWDISFDNESRDSDDGSNYKETTNRVSVSEESSSYNKLDAVLETYYTFSGSTYYAEQGLRTLQYSSWAISYATQSTNSVLSAALEKIYYEIGMARYVLRFYGFLQSLAGFRSGSWAGGSWDNPLIAMIAKYILAGSMMAYYPLDHCAYLGWQVPELMIYVNANFCSALSCCFWTVYIIGDIFISCLKWNELNDRLGDLSETMARTKKNDIKEEHDVSLCTGLLAY